VPSKDKEKPAFNLPLARPNPALQSSTSSSTDTSTEPSTSSSTFTSTSSQQPAKRHRGDLAFEKTHERVTLWLDKGLKRRFEALAVREGASKSTLLDEAVRDLLHKYDAY
jgi:hypothetical protein